MTINSANQYASSNNSDRLPDNYYSTSLKKLQNIYSQNQNSPKKITHPKNNNNILSKNNSNNNNKNIYKPVIQ